MSEYRTHLRESVTSASQALQRLADVLENGESSPATAPPTDFRGPDAGTPCPAPTGASTGHPIGGEPTGATLAPDCRDMATATPAPSSSQPTPSDSQTGTSPRRWWLNMYQHGAGFARDSQQDADFHAEPSRLACIPVVEASAYDAAVRERDAWQVRASQLLQERNAARAELASARRLTPEVVERAAKAIHREIISRPPYVHATTSKAAARAALLAAGFQEVADAT